MKKTVTTEIALCRFQLNETMKLPWCLSSEDLKIAKQRMQMIRIPTHLDFNPHYLFDHPSRLKSHDWKQVHVHYIIIYNTPDVCILDCLSWNSSILCTRHAWQEAARNLVFLLGCNEVNTCRVIPQQ